MTLNYHVCMRLKLPHRILTLLTLTLVSTAAADVIRVASISPLSGERAVLGTEVRRGAEMAVQARVSEFRERGHVLSFFALDDLSNPTRAGFVAQKLKADPRILGVVGPQSSGVANAFAEAIQGSPVAVVNPTATNDALTSHNWGFFNRLVAPDRAQAVAATDYIVNTLKAQVVYVISDESTYGNGLSKTVISQLKGMNGVRVGGYMGASKEAQFGNVISEINRAKADVVYYAGADVQGALMLKAIRAAGIKAPFVGGDGLYSTAFTEAAGKDGVGVVFTSTFAPPAQLRAASEFVRQYKSKYKSEPNGRALYAYDAMNVLLDAILVNLKRGAPAPTREQVIKAVRAYSSKTCDANCPIITGPVAFNSAGERQSANVYLLRVGASATELLDERKVSAEK